MTKHFSLNTHFPIRIITVAGMLLVSNSLSAQTRRPNTPNHHRRQTDGRQGLYWCVATAGNKFETRTDDALFPVTEVNFAYAVHFLIQLHDEISYCPAMPSVSCSSARSINQA